MNTDRFKFRVFYKKDNEYLDPKYYEEFCLSPDGKIHIGLAEWNGIYDELRVIPQKDLIVEQCTGLADKNGKLIYKGDVVRDDKGIKSVVIWLHGGFYLEYKDGGLGDLASFSIDLEIIGNIHDDQFRDLTEMMEDSVCE